MLEVKELSKKFKDAVVVDKLSFNVNKGEIVGLLGENGAGKTTLLKTISGLVKYKNGKIKYDNNEFLKWSYKERGKLISYIPQYIHTNQNYRVEDVILMGITPYLGIFDMPSEEHYKMVDDILKKLNICHLKNKCIGELSGGERRMVYLGRILMQECKILLLDEPNTFLDYVRQHDFFSFIDKFIKDNNLIALVTVHDINLALRYGDKIVILSDKSVVETIDCTKEGYEIKFVECVKRVYNRELELIYTKVGPMVVC